MGRVTTQSGTYEIWAYKNICDTMKNTFKRYWRGQCDLHELEMIKTITGLSHAEIQSCQYQASLEMKAENQGDPTTMNGLFQDKYTKGGK